MAYGNQWMNPTFYKNMTNEQGSYQTVNSVVTVKFKTNLYLLVDWASLAQQWIKMKETSPIISPGQQVKIPLSEHSLLKLGQHVDVVPQNSSNVAAVSNKMLGDHNITSPDTS